MFVCASLCLFVHRHSPNFKTSLQLVILKYCGEDDLRRLFRAFSVTSNVHKIVEDIRSFFMMRKHIGVLRGALHISFRFNHTRSGLFRLYSSAAKRSFGLILGRAYTRLLLPLRHQQFGRPLSNDCTLACILTCSKRPSTPGVWLPTNGYNSCFAKTTPKHIT